MHMQITCFRIILLLVRLTCQILLYLLFFYSSSICYLIFFFGQICYLVSGLGLSAMCTLLEMDQIDHDLTNSQLPVCISIISPKLGSFC